MESNDGRSRIAHRRSQIDAIAANGMTDDGRHDTHSTWQMAGRKAQGRLKTKTTPPIYSLKCTRLLFKAQQPKKKANNAAQPARQAIAARRILQPHKFTQINSRHPTRRPITFPQIPALPLPTNRKMSSLADIVPPGVVTGDNLVKLLDHARSNGYAIRKFWAARLYSLLVVE